MAREILQQANDAKLFPVACVTTASRAVEAMLAEAGIANRKLSLKKRIDKAVEGGLLPPIMGEWAHEVREFGRDGHTDEDPSDLPDKEEVAHVLQYANMLAQYLFVLPLRIRKARGNEGE